MYELGSLSIHCVFVIHRLVFILELHIHLCEHPLCQGLCAFLSKLNGNTLSMTTAPTWPIRHSRSFCSYNNILVNFGQMYSNSCYTTLSIATLGMCIACEFHQLWVVRLFVHYYMPSQISIKGFNCVAFRKRMR